MTGAAMRNALRLLHPSRLETDFLRACLCPGETAREAWRCFSGGETAPVHELVARCPAIRRFLPLLYSNLQANEATLGAEHQSWLRAATVRERLRDGAYWKAFRETAGSLSAGAVRTLVLRGAALAETVYPSRELRHCHDLDLLVGPEAQPRALELLAATRRAPGQTAKRTGTCVLEHRSGLPVAVHTRLFPISFYQVSFIDLCDRSRGADLAGIRSRILAPEDMLVHICGHAGCSSSRDSLQWVCDAWMLIHRTPDLDWDAVLERACRIRIQLPVAAMLDYLAKQFHAPIPAPVLEAFARAADAADAAECEAAFVGLQRGRRGGVRSVLSAAGGLAAKAHIVRWKLFPSPKRVAPV